MIAVQNRPRPWKVYEVDPMTCPKCGGSMKVVAFLTDFFVVDRIIDHLKLTFAAAKPPRLMSSSRSRSRRPRRAGNISKLS